MWYSNFIKTSSEERDVKYLGKLSDRVKRTGIPPYLSNMLGFSTEGPYGDPGVYQSGEMIDKLSDGGGRAVFSHDHKMDPELSGISKDPYMLIGDVYHQPVIIHEATHSYQPEQVKVFDNQGVGNKDLVNFGFNIAYVLDIRENIANFNTLVFYLYNNPKINISYILSMMFAKYNKPKTIFNNMVRVFFNDSMARNKIYL